MHDTTPALVAAIDLDVPGPTISRHLYGQFAEHLGRCIYDGFWVGEDADVPHVGGIRADVVDALRELAVPNLRWPGAASPTSTTGTTASDRASSGRAW